MNILHIVPSLDPCWGGPAKSVPALAAALKRIGHRAEIFTTDWPLAGRKPGTEERQELRDSVPIRIFPSTPFRFDPRVPTSPLLMAALQDGVGQFDVVHFHVIWNPVVSFGMRLMRRQGLPYVVAPRGAMDPVVFARNRWKKMPWAILWERANLERAACVHFTARAESEKAAQCGWSFRRVVISPNLINLDEWRDLPERAELEARFPILRGREVVLFAGRINWVKNLDLLIQAMALLRQERQEACLVCAGPDNEGYQRELEQLAARQGLAEHVIFAGMLQGRDLRAAYARADVFALVSKRENFGMAAGEALAAGLPLVISDGVDLDLPESDVVARTLQEPSAIATALARQLELRHDASVAERARDLIAHGIAGALDPLVQAYKELQLM